MGQLRNCKQTIFSVKDSPNRMVCINLHKTIHQTRKNEENAFKGRTCGTFR